MKNTVFALALAAAGVATVPALAQAQEGNAGNSSFFVNGNVGQSNLSKGAYDDSDVGYDVNIGYRWALNPNVALGVEGGYANLGSFKVKSGLDGTGIPDAEVHGWTLGVNGHFNINPNWYVSARGGFFRGDIKGAYFAGSTPIYVDDTSSKYYAGAGFGYDFSNNFSIGLNYDYYKADKGGLSVDPNLVSVSGEYRF
jgi:OOP family OmpA-OmpF porin/outer membrane immunogenic protein